MLERKKLYSKNPATGDIIWEGYESNKVDISNAITKAKTAQIQWETYPLEKKKEIILCFSDLVKKKCNEIATLISEENGKPFWESTAEVNSLVNKVQVVFDAYDERALQKVQTLKNNRVSITRYKPHGVMGVLGPFNFPMSMPNSHIMPALYAGNAIIFKPSERTPKSALLYQELWNEAGLPSDVLQIVNGDHTVGKMLVNSDDIDGILFIGSYAAGKEIEQILSRKNKISVLEMGGNSPLVVWDYSDIRAAINISIQSAYISSGQRCSAARRLIVNKKIYDEFIPALSQAVKKIRVGFPLDKEFVPFMGPMIDNKAVKTFISDYKELINSGAKVLVPACELTNLGDNFVSPGLLDITDIPYLDKEIFGPLLQITVVKTIDEAIEISNKTKYGLAAGIVTEDKSIYDLYLRNIKAGLINWNQPLTGSTTIAPFGGIKGSGNFRPAGYLSVDYCVYPCASIESINAQPPSALSPGLEF